MSDWLDKMGISILKNQENSQQILEKFVETARPSSVFAPPLTAGEYTVITASEVYAGMGVGYGGGGGGVALGRPVAAITIGPDGVSVEPIVDATKIAIALFTTIGAMALMFSRMARMSRK
jgi:uncharacterized spore protein YtfJ